MCRVSGSDHGFSFAGLQFPETLLQIIQRAFVFSCPLLRRRLLNQQSLPHLIDLGQQGRLWGLLHMSS